MRKNTIGKRLSSLMLALFMLFGLAQFTVPEAQAKTLASQPAENVFFYVRNSAGNYVLLRIMTLDELHDGLSHSQGLGPGDKSGDDYFVSYTDNLPTDCYRQGVGFTLYELAEYVEDTMDAPNLAGVDLTFSGEDRMGYIPTDTTIYAGGTRSYNSVYGVQRYYFEGLYDYWSAAGFETNSGLPDSNYHNDSGEAEPVYFSADKNAVFATGVPMDTILMTESYSNRVMYLQDKIAANEGVVANCLKGSLERGESMSIGFTQTEQGMRTGERTASTNIKWIYQVDLDMVSDPVITTEAVAAPTCSISVSGNTATITFACDTPGATIYHNLVPDGEGGYFYQAVGTDIYDVENYGVMYPYTGEPIEIDITKLSSMNVRYRAVKEGCSDAGLQTLTYPKIAPTFPYGLQLTLGSDVVFSPSGAPGSEVWTAWTGAITGIGLQYPNSSVFTAIDAADYAINDTDKTITLDKSLFTAKGNYAIQIKANGYQDRVIYCSLRGVAPAITPAASYILGQAITLTFDDPYEDYGPGATVNVTPPGYTTAYSIPDSHLTRDIDSITIKESYMSYAPGRIKAPGYYKLTIANGGYIPATQDVYVTVVDPPVSSYTVSVDESISGGTVEVSPSGAPAGETITLTVTPAAGKRLAAGSLKYTADGGATYTAITAAGGVYSFTLPAADVTVTARFEDIPTGLAGDVNGDGVVNVLDVVQAVNFTLGSVTPTQEQFSAADTNEDGVINVLDVVQIVNKALEN